MLAAASLQEGAAALCCFRELYFRKTLSQQSIWDVTVKSVVKRFGNIWWNTCHFFQFMLEILPTLCCSLSYKSLILGDHLCHFMM